MPGRFRLRRDKVDITGVVTLRHDSRLHHIGIGRRLVGTRVLVLVDALDVRVITADGELLRSFTLDPTRDYQPRSPLESPASTAGRSQFQKRLRIKRPSAY